MEYFCEAYLCVCISGRGHKLCVDLPGVWADSGYGGIFCAGCGDPAFGGPLPLESAEDEAGRVNDAALRLRSS